MIEKFLSVDSGYGSGSGDGSGSGYGDGDGYGSGSGDGSGSGYGSGSGDGYGSGSGSGDGIIAFNGQDVHYIDGVPTVIERVCMNLAKGYIVNKDLTTTTCYIAKDNEGHFAHGESFEQAKKSLEEKALEDMDEEERIEKFLEHFDLSKPYKGKEFFDWHHILTGSCEFGRNAFVMDHGLDLDKEYSVKYFLDITMNSYGSEVIRRIQERIKA